MKSITRFLRAITYVIVSFTCISLIFYGIELLMNFIIQETIKAYLYINNIALFIVLLITIGYGIIIWLVRLFRYISSVIMLFISLIYPFKNFALKVCSIFAVASGFYEIYYVFSKIPFESFLDVLIFIVFSYVIVRLVIDIINSTYKIRKTSFYEFEIAEEDK